jgi:hypothetical protein
VDRDIVVSTDGGFIMRDMRKRGGGSKAPLVEKKLGMSLTQYFRAATARGLTQEEMAKELEVSKMTVIKWMRERHFKPYIVYIEEPAAKELNQ